MIIKWPKVLTWILSWYKLLLWRLHDVAIHLSMIPICTSAASIWPHLGGASCGVRVGRTRRPVSLFVRFKPNRGRRCRMNNFHWWRTFWKNSFFRLFWQDLRHRLDIHNIVCLIFASNNLKILNCCRAGTNTIFCYLDDHDYLLGCPSVLMFVSML
jgi:hypothetical protein